MSDGSDGLYKYTCANSTEFCVTIIIYYLCIRYAYIFMALHFLPFFQNAWAERERWGKGSKTEEGKERNPQRRRNE